MEQKQLKAGELSWGWFLALGLCFILFGGVALSSPYLTTFAVVQLLGYLLLFSALVHFIYAIKLEGFENTTIQLMYFVLCLVAGLFVVNNPMQSTLMVSYILAFYFVLNGALKTYSSFQVKPLSGWRWVLTSGLISIGLGAYLLYILPTASMWLIGTFLAIDLFFTGLSLTSFSLVYREAKKGLRKKPFYKKAKQYS